MSSANFPHPLPPELVDMLSERLGLFADSTRIRILDELYDGERNVQSIADALTTTQQNVSGHLRLLRAARVVSRRPAGREVFYEVVDRAVFDVWEQLLGGLQASRR